MELEEALQNEVHSIINSSSDGQQWSSLVVENGTTVVD